MSFLRPSKRTHERSEITPIVDGESAYLALLEAVRAAKRFVYIATWGFESELELTRTGSNDPVLGPLLLQRARDGLEIKVLVWDFLSTGHPIGTIGDLFRVNLRDFKQELAAAGATAGKGTGLFLTRNPAQPKGRSLATASDHQKFWLVDEAGGDPVAFVGGINLGQHEWDSSEHKPADRRRTSPGLNRDGLELQDALKSPFKAPFVRGRVAQALDDKLQVTQRIDAIPNLTAADKVQLKERAIDLAIEYLKKQAPAPPRHDVTSRIRGPAAGEVLEEFRARWKIGGSGALGEKARTIASPKDAAATVQIGHTAHYVRPGGAQDVWRAYLHALARAERFVYIENQYFTSPSIRNALIERLRRRRDLRVVIVLPGRPEEPLIGPAITLRQSDTVRQVRDAAARVTPRQDRVHVLSLATWDGAAQKYEGIYVHAKVAIVDDEWMTIGSANTFSRSFELDTELNAFTTHVPTIVALRRRLWSEHLGIAENDDLLKRPDRAIRRMVETAAANEKKASGALNGRLRPMTFDLPAIWLRPLYNTVADEFL